MVYVKVRRRLHFQPLRISPFSVRTRFFLFSSSRSLVDAILVRSELTFMSFSRQLRGHEIY